MRTYEPPAASMDDSEVEPTGSTSVAPLVQFFELVHIGDMIQSIIQVYFDKELVCDMYRPGLTLIVSRLS